MGIRFRKSINLGNGFRINVSKSGVGYSWGVKGARVTRTADGNIRTTASIPGSGISYVKEISGKRVNSKDEVTSQSTLDPSSNYIITKENRGVDADNYKPAEFRDVIRAIKFRHIAIVAFIIIGFVVSVIIPDYRIFFGVLILGLLASFIWKIDLEYELDDAEQEKYDRFCEAWKHISKSKRVYLITQYANVRDSKQAAGAHKAIQPREIDGFKKRLPRAIRSNIKPPIYRINGQYYIWFPDMMLVINGSHVGAISRKDLTIQAFEQPFGGFKSYPKDAQFREYKYVHANADGTADKRYKSQIQIPVYTFGKIRIESKDRTFYQELLVSSFAETSAFDELLSE